MLDLLANHVGYEVLTPDGFRPFTGLSCLGVADLLRLRFGNRRTLDCTPDHRLIRLDGSEVAAADLQPGMWVRAQDGRRTKVKTIAPLPMPLEVFDLMGVAGHRYITSGVASHNCDFISDDETLINPLTLTRLTAAAPVQYTDTVRWFSVPEPGHSYLVSLDPSLGTGRDHAAIQVFELPEMRQVAEWQHNSTAPRGQVIVLLRTLYYLEDVLRADGREPELFWTVENNSLGEAILTIIEDTGEDRFPGAFVSELKRRGQSRRFRKGLTTTNRNKLAACARLKSLIESGRMTVCSTNLIRQLKNFVATESSFKGKMGEHDDLVSATLLIVRMLDVVLAWGTEAGDLREHIGDAELEDSEPMPVVF